MSVCLYVPKSHLPKLEKLMHKGLSLAFPMPNTIRYTVIS